jgi:adenylate kinase family enzyme
MKRVLVIGSPGAGKSTLATDLAHRLNLPLIHLDQHAWLPGWIELDRDSWKAKVGELIAGDQWVIDGNYSGSLNLRLTRADTVINLELSAWRCLTRLMRRIVSTWGRVRADMAEDCPEQLDWSFLLYTARFPRTHRRKIAQRLESFRGTVVTLRTPAEVTRFLASVGKSG